MSQVKRPGPGSVGLVMGAIGWALQIAYKPEDHPLVVVGAKWLVWVGLALLTWWALQWIWEHRRARRVVEAKGNVELELSPILSIGTILTPTVVLGSHWHAGCSTALGPALPDRKDLEGLLIFLNHDGGSIPEGDYLCDVLIGGNRARARLPRSSERKQLSAIYPTEFTEGLTIQLPLPPGVHSASWREIKGPTSSFLGGLRISVSPQGRVDCTEPTTIR